MYSDMDSGDFVVSEDNIRSVWYCYVDCCSVNGRNIGLGDVFA